MRTSPFATQTAYNLITKDGSLAIIHRALEPTHRNKTEAARQLGMSFRQLRYRLKKLGIE